MSDLIIAAAVPTLTWIVLFLYVLRLERKVRELER